MKYVIEIVHKMMKLHFASFKKFTIIFCKLMFFSMTTSTIKLLSHCLMRIKWREVQDVPCVLGINHLYNPGSSFHQTNVHIS